MAAERSGFGEVAKRPTGRAKLGRGKAGQCLRLFGTSRHESESRSGLTSPPAAGGGVYFNLWWRVPVNIPSWLTRWYSAFMSGTATATMGDRGRLVVPADLRMRAGLTPGAPVILVETEGGIILMNREQARATLQRSLAATDLVASLIAERRAAAAVEDA